MKHFKNKKEQKILLSIIFIVPVCKTSICKIDVTSS